MQRIYEKRTIRYRSSVRPSVRPSHGQKVLKLGLCNFYHTLAPFLYHFSSFMRQYLEHDTR